MMRSTLLPAAAFLAAACGTAWSQFNSAIQGVVTDVSQAVVPDATVRVVNVTTGVVRQASTASDGLYRVLSLAPGEYRVTVEKVGFQTAEETSVSLAINQTARVDFALKLGAVSEKVTVVATAPVVETEQGRVSGEIDSRQLREMPLNTRNLLNLLALEPGMTGRGLSAGYGTGSPGDSFAGETAPSISSRNWSMHNACRAEPPTIGSRASRQSIPRGSCPDSQTWDRQYGCSIRRSCASTSGLW